MGQFLQMIDPIDAVPESADAVLEYMSAMYYTDPKGYSEIPVISYEEKDGYFILYLPMPLSDTTGVQLKIGKHIYPNKDANFFRYDELSKTILMDPTGDIAHALSAPDCKPVLVSDMRFLIRAAKDFYRDYGDYIRLPEQPELVQPVFPKSGMPTSEQAEAAEGILRARTAYVWGAPGTGKTQFVLSAAIWGCLRNGERVAVIAPTNNSVEQVLRGVLAAIPEEEIKGKVIRLGMPTKEFFKEHSDMCEDFQAQKQLNKLQQAFFNLEEVAYERAADALRVDFDSLMKVIDGIWDADDLRRKHPELYGGYERIMDFCKGKEFTERALDMGGSLEEVLARLMKELYERQRPALEIAHYKEMSDSELSDKMQQMAEEIQELSKKATDARISESSIIACTPQKFILRFRPNGSKPDGKSALNVDRIFLDEAGYCGLVQALPLFSNGVPVVMLGDHMQLPPVNELDEEHVREWATRGDSMNTIFLWSLPALFCEQALTSDMDSLRASYMDSKEPLFDITDRYDLTSTHRFASNLAAILDEYVYKNGLTGSDGSLRMLCADTICTKRMDRDNEAEAKKVAEIISKENMDPSDFCVLTPYTKQISMIKSLIDKRYKDCVMTVHGSQGREWNTVILSVADNRIESRPVPFRFTSSATPIGMKVINTAVSRAKKRLIIVCDKEFWSSRDGELIAGLLEGCEDY